jgi:hypothetical protein
MLFLSTFFYIRADGWSKVPSGPGDEHRSWRSEDMELA